MLNIVIILKNSRFMLENNQTKKNCKGCINDLYNFSKRYSKYFKTI